MEPRSSLQAGGPLDPTGLDFQAAHEKTAFETPSGNLTTQNKGLLATCYHQTSPSLPILFEEKKKQVQETLLIKVANYLLE